MPKVSAALSTIMESLVLQSKYASMVLFQTWARIYQDFRTRTGYYRQSPGTFGAIVFWSISGLTFFAFICLLAQLCRTFAERYATVDVEASESDSEMDQRCPFATDASTECQESDF